MCTMHFHDLFLKINKFKGIIMGDLSTLYEKWKCRYKSWCVSRLVEYHKKSFQHLIKKYARNWYGSQFNLFGSNVQPFLGLPSKNHLRNYISCISLKSRKHEKCCQILTVCCISPFYKHTNNAIYFKNYFTSLWCLFAVHNYASFNVPIIN